MKQSELDKLLEKRADDIVKKVVKRRGSFISDSRGENYLDIHKRRTTDAKIIEFQKRADDLFLTAAILRKPAKELNLYKSFRGFVDESELAKAMDSVTSGSGADWVPTDFSDQLIEKVQLARKVAAIFPRIDMPTDPFKMPGKSSFSTAKLQTSENTAVTATNVGTRNVTLNAIKLVTEVDVSMELIEDSIIAILPTVREDIVNAINRAEEDALINGDTATPHMDSDTTATDSPRKSWIGLRGHAVDQSYTTTLSTFNFDNIVGMKKNMGIYGVDNNMLVWIAGIASWSKLLSLRDSQNNNVLITMDKVGPKATVLTGQVGVLLGSPVLVSEFVREDLNTAGVFDPTAATKTTFMLVRKDGFVIGDRRKMLVEQFHDVQKQQDQLVASIRQDFQPRYDITTERVVELGVAVAS